MMNKKEHQSCSIVSSSFSCAYLKPPTSIYEHPSHLVLVSSPCKIKTHIMGSQCSSALMCHREPPVPTASLLGSGHSAHRLCYILHGHFQTCGWTRTLACFHQHVVEGRREKAVTPQTKDPFPPSVHIPRSPWVILLFVSPRVAHAPELLGPLSGREAHVVEAPVAECVADCDGERPDV